MLIGIRLSSPHLRGDLKAPLQERRPSPAIEPTSGLTLALTIGLSALFPTFE